MLPSDYHLFAGQPRQAEFGFEQDRIREGDLIALRGKRDSTASMDSVVDDPDTYTSIAELRKVARMFLVSWLSPGR